MTVKLKEINGLVVLPAVTLASQKSEYLLGKCDGWNECRNEYDEREITLNQEKLAVLIWGRVLDTKGDCYKLAEKIINSLSDIVEAVKK